MYFLRHEFLDCLGFVPLLETRIELRATYYGRYDNILFHTFEIGQTETIIESRGAHFVIQKISPKVETTHNYVYRYLKLRK